MCQASTLGSHLLSLGSPPSRGRGHSPRPTAEMPHMVSGFSLGHVQFIPPLHEWHEAHEVLVQACFEAESRAPHGTRVTSCSLRVNQIYAPCHFPAGSGKRLKIPEGL